MKIFMMFILLVLGLEIQFPGLEYEMARVWIVRLGPVVLWMFGAAEIWRKGIKINRLGALMKRALFLGVWTSLLWWSLTIGPDPWKSYWGNYLRGDGIFTFFGFGLLSLWLVYFWENKWLDILCWVVVMGGIIQVFGELSSCSELTKLDCSGWMGSSILVAGLLTMVVPFWNRLYRASMGKRKIGLVVAGVLLTIGLVLTGTWMAVVGVFLIVFGVIKIKKYLMILLAILFVVLAGWSWWGQQTGTGFVAESRQRIWTKGLLAVTKKPFLGWGLANFDYAFEAVEWPIKFNNDVVVDKAHNEVLEYLVTGGITSLLFYFWTWALIFGGIYKLNREKNFFLSVCIIYIFVSSVNVIPIGVQFVYWWLMGILISKKTWN